MLQLRGIVLLHQSLDGGRLGLIGFHVFGLHAHGAQLLAVQPCGEVPLLWVLGRLKSMTVRHLLTVDCHQLRRTWLMLLLLSFRLFGFRFGLNLGFHLLLGISFYLVLSLGSFFGFCLCLLLLFLGFSFGIGFHLCLVLCLDLGLLPLGLGFLFFHVC